MDSDTFRRRLKGSLETLQEILIVWDMMTEEQQDECTEVMDEGVDTMAELYVGFVQRDGRRSAYTDFFLALIAGVVVVLVVMFSSSYGRDWFSNEL